MRRANSQTFYDGSEPGKSELIPLASPLPLASLVEAGSFHAPAHSLAPIALDQSQFPVMAQLPGGSDTLGRPEPADAIGLTAPTVAIPSAAILAAAAGDVAQENPADGNLLAEALGMESADAPDIDGLLAALGGHTIADLPAMIDAPAPDLHVAGMPLATDFVFEMFVLHADAPLAV